MSLPEHVTPGIWRVESTGDVLPQFRVLATVEHPKFGKLVDEHICAVSGGRGGVDTARANAELIANAPRLKAENAKLRAALEMLLVSSEQSLKPTCMTGTPCVGLSCDFCIARAALAKASGGDVGGGK